MVQREAERVLRHTHVATQDADEAQAVVSRLFCNHRLVPHGPATAPVGMTLRADELGPLSVVHLDYGVPVEIHPVPLADFFLVQIPRGGAATVVQDGVSVRSSVGTASVLSPTGEVAMHWEADTPQLCVYLARSVVEHQLELMLGGPLGRPLTFDVGMELKQPENASWLRSVLFLVNELRGSTTLVQRPEIVDSFAATLSAQLLVAQHHNHSHQLGGGGRGGPSVIQAAVDYIEAHIGDPGLTVPAVAGEVGLSVRTLQESFRKELGRTPLTYIKDRRMTIAHRRLRAGDPAVTTVTRIATGVGVTHLGRFSIEYRDRFGESPSQTLAAP